ncbi:MAG: hypothetical protein ACJ71W_16630 [Terriglobales bacterium]
MSDPAYTVRIEVFDALDALTQIITSIVSHMGAVSPTFIDTLGAGIRSSSGVSEESKDFAEKILITAKAGVQMFNGRTDA